MTLDQSSDEGRAVQFAPIPDAAWPASVAELDGAARLNVYRVMAHNPALLKAWWPFRDHVVLHNTFDEASLEIVILRTGFRRGSTYEWMQHVVRGRKAGLGDDRIRHAALPPDQARTTTDAMLMQCVDALIDTNCLPVELQAALAETFGKAGVLDLIATVGMYSLLAYVLESFGTNVDADVAAALRHAPLAGG